MKKVGIVLVVLLLLMGAFVTIIASRRASTITATPEETNDADVIQKVETRSSPTQAAGIDTAQNTSVTPAQVAQDKSAISLSIISPTDGSTVTAAVQTIKGKTLPLAEVYVNEHEARADSAGNFSVPVTLEDGENYFVVFANDADGNSAEQEVTITYIGS